MDRGAGAEEGLGDRGAVEDGRFKLHYLSLFVMRKQCEVIGTFLIIIK